MPIESLRATDSVAGRLQSLHGVLVFRPSALPSQCGSHHFSLMGGKRQMGFPIDYSDRWSCSRFFRGFVFDKDGCLLESEPLIRGQILETALAYAGVQAFTSEVIAEISSTFGQPDDKMSLDLGEVLRRHFPEGPIASIAQGDFVERFAHSRASGWRRRALDESLAPKAGALRLLDRVRRGEYFTAMYTSMPLAMATQSIELVLHATDLFSGPTLVTCSDPRLGGLGKPHRRGWQVLAELAAEREHIRPSELVAVEDRATGAVGALMADYGAVVVVPDPNDGPIEQWDRRGLIESYFADFPTDRKRLIFLKSLLDITFG